MHFCTCANLLYRLLSRYIQSLLSLRGVVLFVLILSHSSKGMGFGAGNPQDLGVCRGTAPFQAFSNDSPLCAAYVTGLVGSGRLGVAVDSWSYHRILQVAFVCRLFRFV